MTQLSDRPLCRPDDLAREHRELHRLRAQRQAVIDLCTKAVPGRPCISPAVWADEVLRLLGVAP